MTVFMPSRRSGHVLRRAQLGHVREETPDWKLDDRFALDQTDRGRRYKTG